MFQRKVKRVVASVEVKAGLKRFVVVDENKAGRCVRESKSRSLLRIELKLVVVADEDKAGRCGGFVELFVPYTKVG